ncbi:hypothetical protein SEEACDC4_21526 [Salmonella enterica subsp. enterica serovar Agona str. SA-4]|nr:hypothetical protein SEEACDC4_21526 [Salmonella enterica subsp. enterica serovar Agona str. SA-4]
MLLLCGLLLLTLAIAVLNTLVPLWLAQANLPTWQWGWSARLILPAIWSGRYLPGI